MKRRILAPFLIILLAAGGYAAWQFNSRDEAGENRLILYGNVDIREVNLGFRVAGRVEAMQFEEGDRVHKGDVLAMLDKTPFLNDLQLASAQLDERRAVYNKMQAGSRVEEIAQARARVAEQKAILENAEHSFERQQKLLKQGVTAEQGYEDALARKIEAKARLALARSALDLVLAGFRAEDIQAAAAQVEAAVAQVTQTRTWLQDTELTAPANGTVLTRVVEPGAIVAAGAIVYSISLESPVWVRTYIDESNLGNFHPGMQVVVETDGGDSYTGQVGFISPDAEFTPKTVQSTELRTDLVYRVRIIIKDPNDRLRRGMPVTVKMNRNGTFSSSQ